MTGVLLGGVKVVLLLKKVKEAERFLLEVLIYCFFTLNS